MYLTCSNEIRCLVIRASTEYNQSNSFIANLFKISLKTVQRELIKEDQRAQNRVPAIRTRNLNIMILI